MEEYVRSFAAAAQAVLLSAETSTGSG